MLFAQQTNSGPAQLNLAVSNTNFTSDWVNADYSVSSPQFSATPGANLVGGGSIAVILLCNNGMASGTISLSGVNTLWTSASVRGLSAIATNAAGGGWLYVQAASTSIGGSAQVAVNSTNCVFFGNRADASGALSNTGNVSGGAVMFFSCAQLLWRRM